MQTIEEERKIPIFPVYDHKEIILRKFVLCDDTKCMNHHDKYECYCSTPALTALELYIKQAPMCFYMQLSIEEDIKNDINAKDYVEYMRGYIRWIYQPILKLIDHVLEKENKNGTKQSGTTEGRTDKGV